MKTVLSIMGTRPEIIKVSPVVRAFAEDGDFESLVLSTSQHREMSDQFLSEFGIVANYDLDVMIPNQTLSYITSEISARLDRVFADLRPDIVLVQGDTTTAFIGGLVAFYHRIPVGHIEAGLRTFNLHFPFPEELNRQMISRLASFNFVPTIRAKENLVRENIPCDTIYFTGNTVVDALRYMVERNPSLKALESSSSNDNTILVTAHRRENLGEPMKNICDAILQIVDSHTDCRVVFPVHPNPRVREVVDGKLRNNVRIDLIEPVDYHQLIAYMLRSKIILTDSGGIQEESACLRKPVLIMRDETERPEIVEVGGGILVGTNKDRIFEQVSRLLTDEVAYRTMTKCRNPFGDGRAANRIVESIRRHFGLPVSNPIGPLEE
ncbi:MAG: UDP-N-acetylglucosamine 2-epimerase (non-hydrolyzing) [Candidatus Zixiibacteriota bacterium]